jgi:hypothetical protein
MIAFKEERWANSDDYREASKCCPPPHYVDPLEVKRSKSSVPTFVGIEFLRSSELLQAGQGKLGPTCKD